MTTPPTIEERVSRLEGGYEHLATKADLERVRAELKAEIRDSKISTIPWLTGIMAGLTAAQIGAVVALFRAMA